MKNKQNLRSVHKIISLLSIVVLIFGGSIGALASESETPKELKILYAAQACLMDAESGRVLFEKGDAKPLPMASTTKIMTCIITLENAVLSDLVLVSSYAARQPDVQLNINTGEEYCLEDLLYSLMLESHNDAAVAIAEHVGGSVEGFAGLMNEKAKEIGCNNTYFITPNGLDATDDNGTHATTAADLARIMSYCIKQSPKREEFLKITQTPNYNFTNKISKDGEVSNGSRSFSCTNHNAFLNMMEGALSGKTGFTGNAGYCYVGALKRGDKTFVVALLACGWPNNKSYKWSDTKKLMTFGLDHYNYAKLSDYPIEKEKLLPIEVLEGQTKELGEQSTVLVTADEKRNTDTEEGLLVNEDETISLVYEIKDILNAPVTKGDVVGCVRYMLNQEEIKSVDIVAQNDVPKIDLNWCINKIVHLFLIQ